VIGLTFTDREWKGLVNAERLLASYDFAARLAQHDAHMVGPPATWVMAAKSRAKASLSYLEYAITVLEERG